METWINVDVIGDKFFRATNYEISFLLLTEITKDVKKRFNSIEELENLFLAIQKHSENIPKSGILFQVAIPWEKHSTIFGVIDRSLPDVPRGQILPQQKIIINKENWKKVVSELAE